MIGDSNLPQSSAFVRFDNTQSCCLTTYQLYPIYTNFINPFITSVEIPQKSNNKRRRPSKYNKNPKVNYSDEIIDKSIKEYQQLEHTKVTCSICKNNVELLKSFGQDNKFTCLDCSVKIYKTVGDLPDWEKELDEYISDSACPCQRIKHTKDLSSFIRFNNKTGKYEIGQLCIFCRNVKRYEYIRKQSTKRSRDENMMFLNNNTIVEHPIKRIKIQTVGPINEI